MRELTSHKVNGLNDALRIEVLDTPGPGNACHEYTISLLRPSPTDDAQTIVAQQTNIHFQNGPIVEAGFNGISNEALLAIVEDRLAGFQSGKFACAENLAALKHIQDAMKALQSRTKARLARGVEGTSKL